MNGPLLISALHLLQVGGLDVESTLLVVTAFVELVTGSFFGFCDVVMMSSVFVTVRLVA